MVSHQPNYFREESELRLLRELLGNLSKNSTEK